MKYKSLFLFAVIGGIIGLIFHLIWHFKNRVQLFTFASHNIAGTLYILSGMIIGVFLWYLCNTKEKCSKFIKQLKSILK